MVTNAPVLVSSSCDATATRVKALRWPFDCAAPTSIASIEATVRVAGMRSPIVSPVCNCNWPLEEVSGEKSPPVACAGTHRPDSSYPSTRGGEDLMHLGTAVELVLQHQLSLHPAGHLLRQGLLVGAERLRFGVEQARGSKSLTSPG